MAHRPQTLKNISAREAAYKALLAAFREEAYLNETLLEWKKVTTPSQKDFSLAKELAFGTMRQALYLEKVAKSLSSKNKLSLKRKERTLLLLALYQSLFLTKVPAYATTNEMTELAKQVASKPFAGFLHALLQKVFKNPPAPSSEEAYPPLLVEKLRNELGTEQCQNVLEAMNLPSKSFALLGKNDEGEEPFHVVETERPAELVQSKNAYIMNPTPLALIADFSKALPAPPKTILDLAASPGGKSIAALTLYPEAELHCNDISEQKIEKLKENFKRLQIGAAFHIGPGEQFPTDQKFDLVIADVPCSNSGVLGKKPEARLRFTKEQLNALKETQKKLLTHALQLLKPDGQLWYLTCSILEEENGARVRELLTENPHVSLVKESLHLPSSEGHDGGYGAILKFL